MVRHFRKILRPWTQGCILYAKGKLKPKTFHIIRAIFGFVMIVLGFYVLWVIETLQRIYPQKHYSVGAWIVIVLGILNSSFIFLER